MICGDFKGMSNHVHVASAIGAVCTADLQEQISKTYTHLYLALPIFPISPTSAFTEFHIGGQLSGSFLLPIAKT